MSAPERIWAREDDHLDANWRRYHADFYRFSEYIRADLHDARVAELEAENARLREVLEKIACFDDTYANKALAQKPGYFGAFDEPASVETARAALGKGDG